MPPKQNKTPGAGSKRKRGSRSSPFTPSSSANTPNNAQGRPSNVSRATRENRIDNFRQRLYPQVTTRRVIEVLLETNNDDAEAAYQQYMAARRQILANLGHPQTAQANASDNEDEEGGGEQGEDGETTAGQVQALPDTIELLTETDIPWNANTEQERRNVAYTLREHVRDSTLFTDTLTRTEAILWNHLQEYDIATAQETFQSVNHVRRQLARIFDKMRTPLQRDVVHMKTRGTGGKKAQADANEEEEETEEERAAAEELKRVSMSQDERLAEFINITGRPDWYSLLLVLQAHNWNLVRAVEQWYRDGVPPYTDRPKRYPGQKGGIQKEEYGMRLDYMTGQTMTKPSPEDCIPSNLEADEDDQWRDEDDFFDPEEEGDSELEETPPPPPTSESKNNDDRKKPGFTINRLTKLPYKGMPNPRRFVFEYIQNGKYVSNIFEPEKFYFPERGEDENRSPKTKRRSSKPRDKPVLFDWNNGKHITFLTNWYRQNLQRTVGTLRRAAHQTWSEAERQWLHDRMTELFQKHKAKNPNKSDDEILEHMHVDTATKNAWEKAYNEEFVGTKQSGGIRKPRNAAALMTMRSRDARICEDFLVKPDDTYFTRRKHNRVNEHMSHHEVGPDPYGQYDFTDFADLDLEGYMRTSTLIEQVDYELYFTVDLNERTFWFWGRVLAAITELYMTRMTVQDQAVAMELLNWVGLPEIDVMTMSEDEVLEAIRDIRDAAPLEIERNDVEMEDEDAGSDSNEGTPRDVPDGASPSHGDADEPPAKRQRLE
ncbi:hypothetical protein EDD36DRAFT_75073 [Exophiala viscosa]|uniref:Uncharacterized protein n=1 Tax=Exophiala viscosa TaxID=2486360 RepID=A0AAN6IBE8_9EURO|nr:hypothetical protein EDD36DRAFT_75073 [Exophiala viscosa]